MPRSNDDAPQVPPEGGAKQAATQRASESPRGSPRPDGLVANAWFLLAVALAAGAIAGTVLHFHYPLSAVAVMTGPPSDFVAARRDLQLAHYKNSALVYALAGAVVATCLALAEGLARKSALYVVVGIVSGVVFGGGLGLAAGIAAQFVSTQPMESLTSLLQRWPGLIDMATSILMQAAGWTLAGLGIGLGSTLPTWRCRAIAMATAGGVLGGLLAALVYPTAVGMLFPQFKTDMVVPPESANRFAWLLTTAGFIGLLMGGLGRKHSATTS